MLAAFVGGGVVWWRRRKQKIDGLAPARQSFKPSPQTEETYRVRPATPYDLVLPYLEQIMFTEDSMRGKVSVRALDQDPEQRTIFVARS